MPTGTPIAGITSAPGYTECMVSAGMLYHHNDLDRCQLPIPYCLLCTSAQVDSTAKCYLRSHILAYRPGVHV